MFIRRKKNSSGSVSVQFIQKVGRIHKVVKSFGVWRTDRELELLENIARFEKEKLLGPSSLSYDPEDLIIDSFVSTLYNEDIAL